MGKGFDCVSDCTSHGQQIIDSGFTFVARYYTSLSQTIKTRLSREEALHLSGMGIDLVTVFENAADHAGYFKYSQGSNDGRSAFSYAFVTVEQPEKTPVYFTVDYDATEVDLQQKIIPYFQAIRQYTGGYLVGVYGSGFVCRRMIELGLVHYTWLAQATGWAEYEEYNASGQWNLLQGATTTLFGLEVDLLESNGDGGGFQVR